VAKGDPRTVLAVTSATARFVPVPITIISRPQGWKEKMKNLDKPLGGARKPTKIRTTTAATCAILAFSMVGAIYARHSEAQTVTKNFEAAIPNIPGKSLLAVEVDYAPGAASASHTHAKSAFIYAYVILGSIESEVNDGEPRIYREGESWSEPSGAIHLISRNASKTEPAKLLAVFVLDTNDNPLTTPIK
jgi:quercetin dioxygenase-like cupin family protein